MDSFKCCGSGNCCPAVVIHDKDAVDNENVRANAQAVRDMLLCQCDGGERCMCGDKCNCESGGECICGCYLDE